MYIKTLSLLDYRNIDELNLTFNKGINILYGDNGQGKTNIVESIYLLAKLSSFRTNENIDLISNSKEESYIAGSIQSTKKEINQKINVSNKGKICYVNNLQITKFSDYLGISNAICFSPEDVYIFKNPPRERRRLLDSELSSLFPIYIKQLILFRKVLEQRNELLKQRNIDLDLVSVLDEQLIKASYDVYKRRKWLVNKLSEFTTSIYSKIAQDNQLLTFKYQTYLDEENKEEYLQKAQAIYKSSLEKDKERGFTNLGIHKDDFIVYMNDKQVDTYASQGQQRMIAIALKLAIFEIITKANKEEPILILDDAFSELDAYKTKELFNYISSKEQVFITCTDYKEIIQKRKTTLFKVKDGKIIQRDVI